MPWWAYRQRSNPLKHLLKVAFYDPHRYTEDLAFLLDVRGAHGDIMRKEIENFTICLMCLCKTDAPERRWKQTSLHPILWPGPTRRCMWCHWGCKKQPDEVWHSPSLMTAELHLKYCTLKTSGMRTGWFRWTDWIKERRTYDTYLFSRVHIIKHCWFCMKKEKIQM